MSPPPAAQEPVSSPFARIAAMVGQSSPGNGNTAPEPPAPVNPGTPDLAAFGRSFDLPAPPVMAPPPATTVSKPFADGVSFGPAPSTPEPASVAVPPPAIPLPPQTPEPATAGGEMMKLGLAALLKGCATQDIGISPDLIPSWVQTSIPLALVRPQLPSGRVILTVTEILRGLEPEMRHLLSPGRPDMRIEIQANEVFHALPVAKPQMAPSAPLPEPDMQLPAGVPWPFEMKQPAAEPTAPASALFVPAAAPPILASAAQPARQDTVPVMEPPPPASVSTFPPVTRPSQFPRIARDSDKHRQMLLRVLLGAQDETFDAEMVVRLTTSQPGVAAAVCFLDGRPVATSGNGSAEAENFLRQAQRMHDHVQPLVALTGIEETETVSVKSDRHMVTFSLQGQVTLGVLHDPLQQEATLREKVTLIARELTGLLQAA